MAMTKEEIEQIGSVVEKQLDRFLVTIQKDLSKIQQLQDKTDKWHKAVDTWQKGVDEWQKKISSEIAELERKINHLAEAASRHTKELEVIWRALRLIRDEHRTERTKINAPEEESNILKTRAGIGMRT